MSANVPCRVVVLIGGNGTNLQALIDRQALSPVYKIVGVISHRKEAYGLTRAINANIPTTVVSHQAFTQREDFEAALIESLERYSPHLIVLAGFMRILSPFFVQHYRGKIVNIHPSLLPHYKGLNTHQRVLDAKEREHGVSVHFVTEELDGGPLIAQVKLPIFQNESVESLTERVHRAEHWLYPTVVEWFAEKRLRYEKGIVTLDNTPAGKLGVQLDLASVQGMTD